MQGYEQMSGKAKEDERAKHMLVKGRWFWRTEETAIGCCFRTKPPTKYPHGVYSVCNADAGGTSKVWTPPPAEDSKRGLPAPDLREIFL